MKTFTHSGDLGDIIYFLPVMRDLGGGRLVITSRERTRQNLLIDDKWQTLQRLLEAQPYVDSVSASNDIHGDVNGDAFRPMFFNAMNRDYKNARLVNLVSWQALANGANPKCQEKAWLKVKPNPIAKFVFNRSPRYHNPAVDWPSIVKQLGKEAVYLGNRDEYVDFINLCGHVPFVETSDLFEAAQIIKGSECFFGNQSCLFAIAEGMKHNVALECWPINPNCLFPRKNSMPMFDRESSIASAEIFLNA